MKKDYFKIVNFILAVILLTINMIYHKPSNFFYAFGASVVYFAMGLVLGIILIGIFMFFYNLFFPENTIKIWIPQRITAGFICAILLSFILQR
jgi:hypothetical protein